MRIGFDGTCLSNRRGFGRFSRLLLEALARHVRQDDQLVVFIDGPSAQGVAVPDRFERRIVEVGEAPSTAASAQGRRRILDMVAMSRAVARSGLDLMYFPATYTFFPVWNVGRLVVTMHDTLALAHPELVFQTHASRLAWKLKEHAAVRLADRIVTVSETSREALASWFHLKPETLRVVTEGPAPIFRHQPDHPESGAVLSKYAIPPDTRYLLYVGGLSPHKNLPRLIDAFSRIDDRDLGLVIVGDVKDVFHTHVPEIQRVIARAEAGSAWRVILSGFVPDAELAHLYNRAYALVQPSLMEGFGLPPVEAMACGTPVLSSRAGSLPEIVGDAGLFFEPTDVESIRAAIRQITSEPELRDQLSSRALKRAAHFSWDHAAEQLLDCFDEVAYRNVGGKSRVTEKSRGNADCGQFIG